MTRKTTITFGLLAILLTPSLYAQATGSIKGKILDSANGEPLIGAGAVINADGKRYFGVSDIDGNYLIPNVPAGDYRVTYSIPGYTNAYDDVRVTAGKAVTNNITLSVKTLQTVEVKAKRVSNTEASLLSKRKKAAAAQDAISSEQISRSPDNDAADAAKRITGVTVIGGRYIYIRGMSERYSSVLVNGAYVTSPLPTRKVVPLDIFPVALLDNMIVSKTFLPNMPGDFGAGSIQLNTKDFPEEREINVSFGLSANSVTTGRDFLDSPGGSLKWLGYDDGTRALPDSVGGSSRFDAQYTGAANQRVSTTDFNQSYSPQTITGIPGGRVSASFGNSYKTDGNQTIGIYVSSFYGLSLQTIKDGIVRRFSAAGNPERNIVYQDSTINTNTGSQLTLSLNDNKNSKYKLTTFYSNQSVDTTRINAGQYDTGALGKQYVFYYLQTQLLFTQLTGEHVLNFLRDSDRLSWTAIYSLATRDQPDTRQVRILQTGISTDSRPITRYFNSHTEHGLQFQTEYSFPFFQWSGLKSQWLTGLDISRRFRDNQGRRIDFRFATNPTGPDLFLDPNELVKKYGLIGQEITGTNPSFGIDSYDGLLTIVAGYSMFDMPLSPKFRTVTGVRLENWSQTTAGYNIFLPSERFPGTISGLEVLPSVNFIYSLTDKTNLRTTYTRTINRPDFIEAARYRYFDDIETNGLINGNPALRKGTINNYDLRYEYYPSASEILAVSAFAKTVDDPIESTINVTSGLIIFEYVNQRSAKMYGTEFEARKSLGFISSGLDGISVFSNFTYLVSQIQLNPDVTDETKANRPLQGMSPYIANVGASYESKSGGTKITVLYNTFGRRIVQVGVATLPNTYEEPWGQLDLTAQLRVSEKDNIKISLGNLLDPKITYNQGTGQEAILISQFQRGITVSASYNSRF